MDIHTAHSRPTKPAPAAYFTGTVWQDSAHEAPAPARVRSLQVTFAPGARTHWHTHPLGQTLHVIAGVGRVQSQGGPVFEIRAGDTVWIPPGEKHWHGAAPGHSMVHIAIQESDGGSHVTWMEPVSETDYAREPRR